MPDSIRLRKPLTLLAGLLLLGSALVIARRPILSGLARLWILNDGAAPADAIVILGGGLEFRAQAAAELYHKGLAPIILISNTSQDDPLQVSKNHPSGELVEETLRRQGIPPDRIKYFGRGIISTRDEILALRERSLNQQEKRFLVPTDIFHSRRVGYFGKHILQPVGCELRVVAIRTPFFSEDNWWYSAGGTLAFREELLKILIYRILYW